MNSAYRTLEVVDRVVVVRHIRAAEVVRTVGDDCAEEVEERVSHGSVDGVGRTTARRVVGSTAAGQGAERIVAVAEEQRFDFTIADIAGDVATAVVEGRADGEFDIVLRTADVIAPGSNETASIQPIVDGLAVATNDLVGVVVVLVETVGRIETDTFEIGVHDEVDNAGHSVGTVGSRCTAGQNFDALDERSRDLVKVGCGQRGVTRLQATAVDQDQGTRSAETAKVDGCSTRGAVGDEGVLATENLRQRVDQVFDADRTGIGNFLSADDSDRAGAFDVRTRDTRTGNDDGTTSRCCFSIVTRVLSHCRLRKQGKAKGSRSRACFEIGVEFHSVNPSIDRPTPEVGSPRNPWNPHAAKAHTYAQSLQWRLACAFRDAPNAKVLLHFARFGVRGVTPKSHLPVWLNFARRARLARTRKTAAAKATRSG